MGLFQYWCANCEKSYSKWKNTEPATIPRCPDCDAEGTKQLGASLQFKGDGFYVNDYATAAPTEVGFAPESDD